MGRYSGCICVYVSLFLRSGVNFYGYADACLCVCLFCSLKSRGHFYWLWTGMVDACVCVCIPFFYVYKNVLFINVVCECVYIQCRCSLIKMCSSSTLCANVYTMQMFTYKNVFLMNVLCECVCIYTVQKFTFNCVSLQCCVRMCIYTMQKFACVAGKCDRYDIVYVCIL